MFINHTDAETSISSKHLSLSLSLSLSLLVGMGVVVDEHSYKAMHVGLSSGSAWLTMKGCEMRVRADAKVMQMD